MNASPSELLMRNFNEIFIELDAARRAALLAEYYMEDCLWIHPGGRIVGRDGIDEASIIKASCETPADELDGANGHDLWSLVLEASRLDEVVEQVIRTLEFSVLAKYAFSLAQSFSAFYNLPASRSSVLNETNKSAKLWRAAGVLYVRNQLTTALDLMGVGVPPRM